MKLAEALEKPFTHKGRKYVWVDKEKLNHQEDSHKDPKWLAGYSKGNKDHTNGDTLEYIKKQLKSGKTEQFGIIVKKRRAGKLMIADGFHRFAAMMALGWKKVPIHIM
jgi:hypothetical protein